MTIGSTHFNHVALIGAGLIGGSLARVIRREQLASHVTAYSRRAETRHRIKELNFADVVVDVVTPAFRLAGGLVFGYGAFCHRFAERVIGWHPHDGQCDEDRHGAHRPLEKKPLNGVANPARDEPAHHMVAQK